MDGEGFDWDRVAMQKASTVIIPYRSTLQAMAKDNIAGYSAL
jgi:hypothetical protein